MGTKTSKWSRRFSFENLHGKRKTVVLLYTSRLEHLKTGDKHKPSVRLAKTKSRRETYVSRKMAVSGNFKEGLAQHNGTYYHKRRDDCSSYTR